MPRPRITRCPPGPEHSWLRFQRYQFDPGLPRNRRQNETIEQDEQVLSLMGLGPRSWDDEVDVGDGQRVWRKR